MYKKSQVEVSMAPKERLYGGSHGEFPLATHMETLKRSKSSGHPRDPLAKITGGPPLNQLNQQISGQVQINQHVVTYCRGVCANQL